MGLTPATRNLSFFEAINYGVTKFVEMALLIFTTLGKLFTDSAKDVYKRQIGEKLSFRRFDVLTKTADEVFGAYSHMGGKMSALVKVAQSSDEKARDVAMHVAASAPQYIDRSAIPADVLDRELAVLKAQALEENANSARPKPENIVEKMVQGRLNKNLKEMCLVDQEFIKDPDQTVAQYLGNGKVLDMVRFQVGEGMQKREENFAEEVAAQMKG